MRSEIPLAKARLEQAERDGTRVKLVETEGAARLQVKTVEEMAEDKAASRKMAAAANKGVVSR